MRPCTYPGCRKVATVEARCDRHQRPSASDRGYDAEWAAYSKAWLGEFPWCGQRQDRALYAVDSVCVQRGRIVLAAVTDHIVPLSRGGARLDPANHQSLCMSCNTKKGG